MKETTREMQKAFEKAEFEETERGIKRGHETEFGDEDLEEYLARMRSIPVSAEEMCLVTKAGPPWYDAITGEELPQELVEKGMQAERESLGSFPVWKEVPESEVKERGGQLIRSRWVLTRKSPIRVKARLVAQQLNLGEWMDAFAATPTSAGLRIVAMLAALKNLGLKFGDVSTAFCHAWLPKDEKLYLVPPEGEQKPGVVWRLERALYGLRRSPQFFQEHFAKELAKIGFTRLLSDPQVFTHRKMGVYLMAHADDMMIAAKSDAMIEVVKRLDSIFKIKWAETVSSDKWSKFLGREWQRDGRGFRVRVPPNYLQSVLKEFSMEKCKATVTPFVPGVRHREDVEEDVTPEKHRLYRRAVGRLLWTVGERPDLAYAVKELARRVQKPTEEDWIALKRMLRYIKGTQYAELGLQVNGEEKLVVRVITDANWASPFDGKSTTGLSVWLNGFLLAHRSKTQATIAQSTCESELLALGGGVMEGKFVQTIPKELDIATELEAHCDSSSAVALTMRRGLGRLRHLSVKQLWLQQEIREARLKVCRVPSAENVSDLFTKAFLGPRFRALVDLVGLDLQPAT